MYADLLGILNPIFSLVILACWIAVLVTAIRNRDRLGTILSLFPVTAFIVGWFDVRRYKLLTPMIAWTGTLVLGSAMNYAERVFGA